MVLVVHSNKGYLNEPNTRSRLRGHFFLSNHAVHPPNNGAILNIAQIIKNVVSSTTGVELGALYITAREAVYICNILKTMGHRQPATPFQTNNLTAECVICRKIQPNCTKAMDMCFHWLQDQKTLQWFIFSLRSGEVNLGDYWTKQHPKNSSQKRTDRVLNTDNRIDQIK